MMTIAGALAADRLLPVPIAIWHREDSIACSRTRHALSCHLIVDWFSLPTVTGVITGASTPLPPTNSYSWIA